MSQTTIDDAEIAKFTAMATEWWDPQGKFKPLHKFNPVRLTYIRQKVIEHFGRDEQDLTPFKNLRFLDIGCGGGLLCEPMARLGAEVVGADAVEKNIKIASLHAQQSELSIDYRATTAEALAEAGEQFDVILNMEVVEHVTNVDVFLKACAKMVKPGGLMFIATLNRTFKSYALAIVGAEYILRWLPKGTHEWDKFVKPREVEQPLKATQMRLIDRRGVRYNPLKDAWALSDDMDVNYMVLAEKRG